MTAMLGMVEEVQQSLAIERLEQHPLGDTFTDEMQIGLFSDPTRNDLVEEEFEHLIDFSIILGVGMDNCLFDSDVDVQYMLFIASSQQLYQPWNEFTEMTSAKSAQRYTCLFISLGIVVAQCVLF